MAVNVLDSSIPIYKINVLTASNSPLVQRGILNLLESEANINIVAQVSSRIEIMVSLYSKKPDVLVVDALNGNQNGTFETIEFLQKTHPETKLLLIIEKRDDSKELIALRMGVRGIIFESADQSEFIRSIKSVFSGKLWIRQYILEKFVLDLLPKLEFNEEPQNKEYFNLLTKRELDIVKLVVRGHKNKEIGQKLYVTEKTVKNHLSHIFRKLNVKKRVELKKYLHY